MTLSCTDSRPFVVLLQLLRQRKVEEVKRLMKQALSLEAAVARVREQVRQGTHNWWWGIIGMHGVGEGSCMGWVKVHAWGW